MKPWGKNHLKRVISQNCLTMKNLNEQWSNEKLNRVNVLKNKFPSFSPKKNDTKDGCFIEYCWSVENHKIIYEKLSSKSYFRILKKKNSQNKKQKSSLFSTMSIQSVDSSMKIGLLTILSLAKWRNYFIWSLFMLNRLHRCW